MQRKLFIVGLAVFAQVASGALTCATQFSNTIALQASQNLQNYWRSFYDVDRVGAAKTDGSFALVFDHEAEALGLGPAFTTLVLRTDLGGATLPEAIAQEVRMRCGADTYCSRDKIIEQLNIAYDRLYSRYQRQSAQRRNIVGTYKMLDRERGARTTHFFLFFEGQFVGHTQVQYSRDITEKLNMETYENLPRRPPGVHVEVGRTVLASDVLPSETAPLAPLNAFIRLYMYRLAFSYSLWDLGANRMHFEVTAAGLKVFQALSRVPLPSSQVETENGPLNFVDISRNLGLHLEEELMQQLMQWRLTRILGHSAPSVRFLVSRSEREVWQRLGWLQVGERGLSFPVHLAPFANGWDISLGDFSQPEPVVFPIFDERAKQWLQSLNADTKKP